MRTLLDTFEQRFVKIESETRSLLARVTSRQDLFRPAADGGLPFMSVGENLLRSAAVVEQTFGGLTTRLWDDPFEWTLPEKLSTAEFILEYLDEVAAARAAGMRFIASDAELARQIPAPDELRSLAEILVTTIADSEHYLGRAAAIFQTLTSTKLRRR